MKAHGLATDIYPPGIGRRIRQCPPISVTAVLDFTKLLVKLTVSSRAQNLVSDRRLVTLLEHVTEYAIS